MFFITYIWMLISLLLFFNSWEKFQEQPSALNGTPNRVLSLTSRHTDNTDYTTITHSCIIEFRSNVKSFRLTSPRTSFVDVVFAAAVVIC